MKYYTREWYNLMQGLDYCLCFKPIEDKDYTDKEIEDLYLKKEKNEVAAERKNYNAPPIFMDMDFDSPDFDLEDFVSIDEETGKIKEYSSLEELKAALKEDRKKAEEEFASRPPFNKKEAAASFKESYELMKKSVLMGFPEYIRDRIDPRLAALELLPRGVYDELKALSRENTKKFNAINKAAEKELSKQKIPGRISLQFGYHDGELISARMISGRLILKIKKDGACFEGETPYTRVTFVNAEIVECDFSLPLKEEGIVWLYDELYKIKDGYEAHMMFFDKYLTVRCSDILIKNNL